MKSNEEIEMKSNEEIEKKREERRKRRKAKRERKREEKYREKIREKIRRDLAEIPERDQRLIYLSLRIQESRSRNEELRFDKRWAKMLTQREKEKKEREEWRRLQIAKARRLE